MKVKAYDVEFFDLSKPVKKNDHVSKAYDKKNGTTCI
jgi:hypothetical protein